MNVDPMPRNLYSPADPDPLMLQHIIEKALQRLDSSRPPDDPAMQPDRQHLRCIQSRRVAFTVQRIEGRLEIFEKLHSGVETLCRREAHVIRIERIRNDEVRYATRTAAGVDLNISPVGKVIRIRVRVIDQTAVLDNQAARVGAVSSRIPA